MFFLLKIRIKHIVLDAEIVMERRILLGTLVHHVNTQIIKERTAKEGLPSLKWNIKNKRKPSIMEY